MQTVISCAKDMTPVSEMVPGTWTVPMFEKEAEESAAVIAGYTVRDLAEILKISPALAQLNYDRYQAFRHSDCPAGPAVFSYTGVAYRHLKPTLWDEEDCAFANGHLWITSFLYGLLRPMDSICQYRLEGNVRLRGGMTMFEFWKPLLTDVLIDSVNNDGGILLYLATEEMTHLFDWKRVRNEVRVVEPLFYQRKGDKLKVVTVHAKMCRGAMASYIIRNRISDPESLKLFEYEGFRFSHQEGDGTSSVQLIFVSE